MHQIAEDLSKARILVTNDDGIDAEGIGVLERVARQFSDDVWVVAPDRQHSGAGHSITLHDPIRIKPLGEKRFTTTGTPTDCVLLAIRELVGDDKPVDLVLSGINRGMNVADDVTYSGTIAGAMEGTLLGVPSVAFSQSIRGKDQVHWETAEHFAAECLRRMQGLPLPKANLLSINFPNVEISEVQGIVAATQGQRKLVDKLEKRLDPKGHPYYWIGNVGFEAEKGHPGCDLAYLKANFVTVTPINMDLTAHKFLSTIESQMGSRGNLAEGTSE